MPATPVATVDLRLSGARSRALAPAPSPPTTPDTRQTLCDHSWLEERNCHRCRAGCLSSGVPEPSPPELPVARVAVAIPLSHLDRTFDYAVTAEQDADAVPGARGHPPSRRGSTSRGRPRRAQPE